MANTMLVCLRTVHLYLLPKAKADGIMLDAQAAQSWCMSLWIAMAHEKAWLYMPSTRFKVKEAEPTRPGISAKTVPFSEPGISPALRKLRQMLERDRIDEAELISILREAAPRGTLAPASLESAPERSLELLTAFATHSIRAWAGSAARSATTHKKRARDIVGLAGQIGHSGTTRAATRCSPVQTKERSLKLGVLVFDVCSGNCPKKRIIDLGKFVHGIGFRG